MKKLEEEWKQQHYVGYRGQTGDNEDRSYLKLLKDFRKKIDIQYNFEKEEMMLIAGQLVNKFKDYKVKLLEVWNVIELEQDQSFESKGKAVETKNIGKYSDL